jgi:predicted nucleic acid-binding protein
MALVDTSVWIRFLKNRAPYASALERLLDLEEVAGHDLVYGELLIGDPAGRENLLASYEHMYQAPAVTHREVVEFVRVRKLTGLGIGWIDAHLLASSIVGRMPLWTADTRLQRAAGGLGSAYDPLR